MGEVCNARDTRLNARLRSKFFPPIFLTTLTPGSFDREADNLYREPSQELHSLEVGDQISRLKSFLLDVSSYFVIVTLTFLWSWR
jgi:hypothetical protein